MCFCNISDDGMSDLAEQRPWPNSCCWSPPLFDLIDASLDLQVNLSLSPTPRAPVSGTSILPDCSIDRFYFPPVAAWLFFLSCRCDREYLAFIAWVICVFICWSFDMGESFFFFQGFTVENNNENNEKKRCTKLGFIFPPLYDYFDVGILEDT